MRTVRVALVDDEPLIRSGLAAVIGAEPDLEVVGQAGDGSEVLDLVGRTAPDVVLMDVHMPGLDGIAATRALVRAGSAARVLVLTTFANDASVVDALAAGADVLDLVGRTAPDVVLMDVRMPGVDGIAATRALVRAGSAARVLVLTTFANDDHVVEALAAGADGFLLKRSSPEELLHGIRTVARGESLLFPDAVRHLVRRSPVADPGAVPGLARLTAREAEVLRLVADGRSNAEIAAVLVVGVETVRSHVAAVLAKTGARDRTQAVVLAYRSGFVS